MKTTSGKTHPEKDITQVGSSSPLNTRPIEVKPSTPNSANPQPRQPLLNIQKPAIESTNQQPQQQGPLSTEDLKREYEKTQIVRLVKWKPEGKMMDSTHQTL